MCLSSARLHSPTHTPWQIQVWLYGKSLAQNFLGVGFLLVGAGLVAVVHGGLFLREDRTGMLVSGAGVLYFVVFHLLANLPADDELMLGVHERFWIQAGDMLAALFPLRKCARVHKHGCVCVHEYAYMCACNTHIHGCRHTCCQLCCWYLAPCRCMS